MMSKKAAVALSGGIDSSVTALLLLKQGYDVVGVSAKMTDTAESDNVIKNAKAVADILEIPFFPFDATHIFKEKVVNYFKDSYKQGLTPNPCIMCNKYIKWGVLFDYAIKELNADIIATGHYADIKENGGFYKLYPASDEHKDQLYFLFLLNQEQLKRTVFPLSSYKKSEVRKIAEENNLPSKSAKESQDICFIPDSAKKYLNTIFPAQKGYFIEKSTGKILGEHYGHWQFTIGQRKGIGIAAHEALYVTDIDAKNNVVYVGYKQELYANDLFLKNINLSYPPKEKSFEALVKIRYNMQAVPACIELNENTCQVKFKEPVSAISKGQACVIYDIEDGHLIGGAFI